MDLNGFGSTTFRREAVERGLEPDECYVVGRMRPDGVPDIAIEVVRSRWKVDKLRVYAGLGIPEVWLFRKGAFAVHVLVDARYERVEQSRVLPKPDLARLASYVQLGENQTQLVKAWRAELRGERPQLS